MRCSNKLRRAYIMSDLPRLWHSCCVLVTCLAACTSFVSTNEVAAQIPSAQHVVVTGVDGLSPDGIRKAATPQLHQLMKVGASTLHARAVMPTVSSPNWASMIMEAGPEQYAITTNN
jgi:predicted AlkP superfamily pyrophosphatase or phosphodiesterase